MSTYNKITSSFPANQSHRPGQGVEWYYDLNHPTQAKITEAKIKALVWYYCYYCDPNNLKPADDCSQPLQEIGKALGFAEQRVQEDIRKLTQP